MAASCFQRVVLHKTHPFCLPCKSPTGTRLLQQRPPQGSFQQLHTGVEYPGSSRRSQLRTRVRDSQLSFHPDRPLSDSGSVPMSSDIQVIFDQHCDPRVGKIKSVQDMRKILDKQVRKILTEKLFPNYIREYNDHTLSKDDVTRILWGD